MKKVTYTILSLLTIALLPLSGTAQKVNTNVFLRAPQVINYDFTQEQVNYNSVMSVGMGFSHKRKFIELATFIDRNDIYGFYTFFGLNLKSKALSDNLNLYTNWFGEVLYVPTQSSLDSDVLVYTSGVCFFLNYGFDWGGIGLPLCIGGAYSQKNFSLNTRAILNIYLNLN
ncbi:MAG: hypothetical protein AAGG68_11190 [Bacteroidota bacterium]